MFCASLVVLQSCSDVDDSELVDDAQVATRSAVSLADFVTQSETYYNETYGDAGHYFDEVVVREDSVLIDIDSNGDVSATSRTSGRADILAKIECMYDCISLTDKAPIYFDLEVANPDNGSGQAVVDVTVGAGSKTLSTNLLRRTFSANEEYNASGNDADCSTIGSNHNQGAAPRIASYVTINQFGFEARPPGSYYDEIDMYVYTGSEFPDQNGNVALPQFGWNTGTPDDLITDFGTFNFWCSEPGYPTCSSLSQSQIDEIYCLQASELNYYLAREESAVSSCAAHFSKDFISLTSEYLASFTGKGFWNGYQRHGVLRQRGQGYQISQLTSPGNGCSCN